MKQFDEKSFDELELMSPKELGRLLLEEILKNKPNRVYIKSLIKAGAWLNITSKISTPLVTLGVIFGDIDIVKDILEAGADVNMCDDEGWSPLHDAVERGENMDMIQILLDAGANIEAKIHDGHTAWNLATDEIKERFPQLKPNYNG